MFVKHKIWKISSRIFSNLNQQHYITHQFQFNPMNMVWHMRGYWNNVREFHVTRERERIDDHFGSIDLVLRSQGKPTSRNHIQQILRAYPQFTPLLNSRVPSNLIPVIWNDPVIRQITSIINRSQVEFHLFIDLHHWIFRMNHHLLKPLKNPFDMCMSIILQNQVQQNHWFQHSMKNIHRISSIIRHQPISQRCNNNNETNIRKDNYQQYEG